MLPLAYNGRNPFLDFIAVDHPLHRLLRNMAEWLDFKTHDGGELFVAEAGRELPFDIARVFYVVNQRPEARRGCHAHRRLSEVVLCLQGTCTFLVDDGTKRQEFVLDTPSRALLLEPMNWLEFYGFSPDCILLVLSDGKYDPDESIHDYKEFLAARRQAEQ